MTWIFLYYNSIPLCHKRLSIPVVDDVTHNPFLIPTGATRDCIKHQNFVYWKYAPEIRFLFWRRLSKTVYTNLCSCLCCPPGSTHYSDRSLFSRFHIKACKYIKYQFLNFLVHDPWSHTPAGSPLGMPMAWWHFEWLTTEKGDKNAFRGCHGGSSMRESRIPQFWIHHRREVFFKLL